MVLWVSHLFSFRLVLFFPMAVGWNKCSKNLGISWVELLVPRVVGWDRYFGALGGLSY